MAQTSFTLNRALPVLVLALLGGCSLFRPVAVMPPETQPQPVLKAPEAPAPAPAPAAPVSPPAPVEKAPPPPVPTREYQLGPAARALVAQAHSQSARGDLPSASATVDRALRIEPSNPLLWVELGRIRLAENDPHQAEGCGRKALALATGDKAARIQAGHLIADALRAAHKNQEAHDFESQAWMN